jgi:DNA-binding response OmpR family regulator
MNILYIEIDLRLSELVKQKLKLNYNIDIVDNHKDGILMIENKEYDLFIFSYHLPQINGIEICKKIREMEIKTPILIVANNQKKEGVVEALDFGADDYLTKPFCLDEFQARIRALIRRNNKNKERHLKIGEILIKLDDQSVNYHNQIIKLSRQEYILLKYLAVNKGKLVSREELYEHVWGRDGYYNSNTIDVHVRRLRNKIKLVTNTFCINTIYGCGYRI